MNIKNFPVGNSFSDVRVNARITDVVANEVGEGLIALKISYLVTDNRQELFRFSEEILNLVTNRKSNEFFNFLAREGIEIVDYDELIGLELELVLTLEVYKKKLFYITKSRRLFN